METVGHVDVLPYGFTGSYAENGLRLRGWVYKHDQYRCQMSVDKRSHFLQPGPPECNSQTCKDASDKAG